MTEIEAIYERHSVRAYRAEKISREAADELKKLIDEVNEAGDLHLQLLEDAGKTFSIIPCRAMGLSSAPAVIACVGRDNDTLDRRIGYYGEKIVLAAQRLGLNTCWAGTFSKHGVPADIRPGERLSLVIAVGYGENPGKPRKSKTADQVSAADGERPEWFNYGVELALLAPTAINQQQFFITLKDDGSVDFRDKGGPYSQVDLGIAHYHFDVGAAAKKGE